MRCFCSAVVALARERVAWSIDGYGDGVFLYAYCRQFRDQAGYGRDAEGRRRPRDRTPQHKSAELHAPRTSSNRTNNRAIVAGRLMRCIGRRGKNRYAASEWRIHGKGACRSTDEQGHRLVGADGAKFRADSSHAKSRRQAAAGQCASLRPNCFVSAICDTRHVAGRNPTGRN